MIFQKFMLSLLWHLKLAHLLWPFPLRGLALELRNRNMDFAVLYMRHEVNSCRFEISNRCETSYVHMNFRFSWISKQPDILIDMSMHFISGSVCMIFYHPKWNFISVKLTDMKSIPAMTFKRTCALNATSNESALIHFISGKLCSHENLMPVWVKIIDMKFIPLWVLFRLNSCEHK